MVATGPCGIRRVASDDPPEKRIATIDWVAAIGGRVPAHGGWKTVHRHADAPNRSAPFRRHIDGHGRRL